MVIYFTLDKNSRLTGWWSNSNAVDDEIELLVDDEHEVLANPEVFKYIDGELVKDEEYQNQLLEDQKGNLNETEQLKQENELLAGALLELSQAFFNGGY